MSESSAGHESESKSQDGLPEHRSSTDPGRATVRAVHDSVRADGEEELQRDNAALFWSGLAAGSSMSFSLIAEGLLRHYLPSAEWLPAVTSFGYSLGFLIVILGRQQLFTENTITVIIPLLHQRDLRTLANVLRVWGIVLVTNLAGGLAVAWVLANTRSFDSATLEAFREIGQKAIEPEWDAVLLRGVYAGWLIALLVWLLPAAEAARLWIVVLITYIISLGHFTHVIAGSIEVFYLAADGGTSWSQALLGYTLPALIGNIIGGVVLTATLNHAQVAAND